MALDDTFDLFHKYNKLVRRQMVKPLACSCGTPLITTLGPADDLTLHCVACDTYTVPGVTTIDNVRAVVKEHFSE